MDLRSTAHSAARAVLARTRKTRATMKSAQLRSRYSRSVRSTWKQVEHEHLTYCTEAQLDQILSVVARIEEIGENGDMIEVGCARGGSAILICAAKSPQRALRVYDMFGMIPPPSEHDGEDMRSRYEEISDGSAVGVDGGLYYLYEADLKAVVERNFERLGFPVGEHAVTLVAGPAQVTVEADGPISLAHIDVDWYEPVRAALERTVPKLTPNGAVIIHAYSDWSGCRKATDDYFDEVGRDQFIFDVSARHLKVTRRAG